MKAALLCWATVAILGCIYLGSTTAFNALVGCNVLLADISFMFPFALLLFGRRKIMKVSKFPLGNFWGPVINAIALGWIIFMVIFFDFPFVYPVTPGNMSKLLLLLCTNHNTELINSQTTRASLSVLWGSYLGGTGLWVVKTTQDR